MLLYMNDVETGCEKWDEESRKELADSGYSMSENLESKIL